MASTKIKAHLPLVFSFANRNIRHIRERNPLNQGLQMVFIPYANSNWLVEAARSAMLKRSIRPQAVLIQSVNYNNFPADGDCGAFILTHTKTKHSQAVTDSHH